MRATQILSDEFRVGDHDVGELVGRIVAYGFDKGWRRTRIEETVASWILAKVDRAGIPDALGACQEALEREERLRRPGADLDLARAVKARLVARHGAVVDGPRRTESGAYTVVLKALFPVRLVVRAGRVFPVGQKTPAAVAVMEDLADVVG